jgi:hypothetical protein
MRMRNGAKNRRKYFMNESFWRSFDTREIRFED